MGILQFGVFSQVYGVLSAGSGVLPSSAGMLEPSDRRVVLGDAVSLYMIRVPLSM